MTPSVETMLAKPPTVIRPAGSPVSPSELIVSGETIDVTTDTGLPIPSFVTSDSTVPQSVLPSTSETTNNNSPVFGADTNYVVSGSFDNLAMSNSSGVTGTYASTASSTETVVGGYVRADDSDADDQDAKSDD